MNKSSIEENHNNEAQAGKQCKISNPNLCLYETQKAANTIHMQTEEEVLDTLPVHIMKVIQKPMGWKRRARITNSPMTDDMNGEITQRVETRGRKRDKELTGRDNQKIPYEKLKKGLNPARSKTQDLKVEAAEQPHQHQ